MHDDSSVAGAQTRAPIEGYASRFGEKDLNGDILEKGAFARCLIRQGPDRVKMLYQHAANDPIGRWTVLREDNVGLYVKGELFLDVPSGARAFALIRGGAGDGLSIGFRAVKAKKTQGSAIRRLIEVDLWEVSVVTFPMAPGARIARVGAAGGAPSLAHSPPVPAGDGARLFAATLRRAANSLSG